MREIKFRAWRDGRAIQVSDIDFVNGHVYGLCFDIQEGEDMSMCRISTLEQFTGLKDKNGKEIYEGDIIESHGLQGKIWYREDTARFACSPDVYGIEDAVIVGNIHENPELLNA